MALTNWAIDVPQKLLQSEAKPYPWYFCIYIIYKKILQAILLKLHYMGYKE